MDVKVRFRKVYFAVPRIVVGAKVRYIKKSFVFAIPPIAVGVNIDLKKLELQENL